MNYLTVNKIALINSLFRYIFQALLVVVISAILGLTFNYFRPNGLSVFSKTTFIPLLTVDNDSKSFDRLLLDEALKEYNLGESLFIDARSHNHYISGHIMITRSIPANRFDDSFEKALKNIAFDKKIIVYCDSFNCDLAEEVAKKLFLKGFYDIKIFEEGWGKWFEAFLPIEEGQ